MIFNNIEVRYKFARFLHAACMCQNFYSLPFGHKLVEEAIGLAPKKQGHCFLLPDKAFYWHITESYNFETKTLEDHSRMLSNIIGILIVNTITLALDPQIRLSDLNKKHTPLISVQRKFNEFFDESIVNHYDINEVAEFALELEKHCSQHIWYYDCFLKKLIDAAKEHVNKHNTIYTGT